MITIRRKTAILITLLIIAIFFANDAILLNWGNLFPAPAIPVNQGTNQTRPSTIQVAPEDSVIVDVVKKTLPGVVTIGVKTTTAPSPPQVNPFNPFSFFQIRPSQSQTVEQNIASGFIVSPDGMIITNKHVVADSTVAYEVITSNGQKYAVTKIYRDPLNDIAVLKINGSNLTPLPLGDSSNLVLGQTVVAIGTPLGEFRNTVTHGIISGLGRGIQAGTPFQGEVEQLNNIIQTDAAINPGNSGGPLINANSQVIGVNTALDVSGENIGFAIPVNVVKTVLNRFNSTGQFNQPFVGIRYSIITPGIAANNNIPQGAYVESVVGGSPAAKAGIQIHDIITKIDGQPVDASHDISQLITGKKIGDKITVELWRNGKMQTLNITLGTSGTFAVEVHH